MRKNRHIDYAKEIIVYYFDMLMKKATGSDLNYENKVEIEGAIDELVEGIIEEIKKENDENAV